MNQPDSTLDGKALTVEVSIDEHPKRTRAKAKLHWRGRELTGIGLARLNPADRNITEIGDELAGRTRPVQPRRSVVRDHGVRYPRGHPRAGGDRALERPTP